MFTQLKAMQELKDNFSNKAKDYAQFRPKYPIELYQYIYSQVQNFDCAWDCGTGNGQVAGELSNKFKEVYASDISAEQLTHAEKKSNIQYFNSRAENTEFENQQFDLITVAQAFHWFDAEIFISEAKRVLKKSGILAIWGYHLIKINPKLDLIVENLHNYILKDYWDKQRELVINKLSTVNLELEEFESPEFQIEETWSFDQLIGYLNTWSAVSKFEYKNGSNPLSLIESNLADNWGSKEKQKIIFPLFVRLGKFSTGN